MERIHRQFGAIHPTVDYALLTLGSIGAVETPRQFQRWRSQEHRSAFLQTV
jgi:hypothetical protein